MQGYEDGTDNFYVTPLAGVWIEIFQGAPADVTPLVTPLAGVWIEISM